MKFDLLTLSRQKQYQQKNASWQYDMTIMTTNGQIKKTFFFVMKTLIVYS
jgi:hypothetical protein